MPIVLNITEPGRRAACLRLTQALVCHCGRCTFPAFLPGTAGKVQPINDAGLRDKKNVDLVLAVTAHSPDPQNLTTG